MKIYKGKVFSNNSFQIKTDKNGKQHKIITEMITLSNLVDVIPNNNWTWWLYDFEGSMVEGENLELPVIPEDGAYLMEWKEVKQFVTLLDNVTNCLLIAMATKQKINFSDVVNSSDISEFPDCKVLIELFDSSTWEIRLSEDVNLVKNMEITKV